MRQSERVVRHREAATRWGSPTPTGDPLSRHDAASTGRLADVSAGERRRRHRLRDHARRPRLRPPRERGAAGGALARARRSSRRSTSTTGCCSARTGKKLSKRDGAPTLAQYPRRGVPAEARAGVPRGARASRAHDVHLDEPRHPAARDRRDRSALGRGARRPCRRAAVSSRRCSAARATSSRRARWRRRCSSRSRSRCPRRRGRRSSGSRAARERARRARTSCAS